MGTRAAAMIFFFSATYAASHVPPNNSTLRWPSPSWATLVVRLARLLKWCLMWLFCSSGAPPVGAGAQQMSLVSCAHQLGPQAQLAISASGGNCSRVHREAPPLHFFWMRTFPLEFLGSEGIYVTLVVSRAQRRHIRGPYQTGKQKKHTQKVL